MNIVNKEEQEEAKTYLKKVFSVLKLNKNIDILNKEQVREYIIKDKDNTAKIIKGITMGDGKKITDIIEKINTKSSTLDIMKRALEIFDQEYDLLISQNQTER